MEIIIPVIAAFVTSLLTFFSGFGLGTILLPVFALFFPVELAVALTGIVHFCNNLFKVFLVGKFANKTVLLHFGIPAIPASFLGAWMLIKIAGFSPLYEYRIGDHLFSITLIKVIIAVLLILFAFFEIIPAMQKITFNRKQLPLGGILSGFFGGLSGIQGAIRSAFLIKSGLSKESYIGTAVVIACFIDITRLTVYAAKYSGPAVAENLPLVISATLAAITGAFTGSRLLKKVTFTFIQKLVAVLLMTISLCLGFGLI